MTGTGPLHDKAAVEAAIAEAGTITGAARLLRVSRKTVYGYIRRYGIEVLPLTRKLAA